VNKDFEVCVNRWLAYSIEEMAHDLLYGSMKEHYCKIRKYLEQLGRSNNVTFILVTDPKL